MTVTDDRLRFQLRSGDRLGAWLTSRWERTTEPRESSVSVHAKAELDLWREALDAELARITLTLPQATAISEVIGGPDMKLAVATGAIGMVYAQCYTAFGIARSGPDRGTVSSYEAQHGVDEDELLKYLLTLGPAADHALADAFSRWWQADGEPTADGFAAVGLRVAE